MTEDGLKNLLGTLSGDRERAGELFVHIHGKLTRYFTWNCCAHPEELAHEVLDRVSRRLEDGEQVERPMSYIFGVARRVLLEQKPKHKDATPLDERTLTYVSPDRPRDSVMDCLEYCLDTLPPESKAFLIEYYSAAASERIRVRQRMATRLGLTVNALRNRALRLRQGVGECIGQCKEGGQ